MGVAAVFAVIAVFLAFCYVLIRFVFPAYSYVGVNKHQQLKPDELALSDRLASVTCSVAIGGTGFGLPLTRVDVFPEGLLIKPPLIEPIVIPRACIRTVEPERVMLDTGLAVRHACPGIPERVVLFVSPDSELGVALFGLSAERVLA
jgi:hypothetical protein